MEKDDKIFVTGHRGMVGSAIIRYLTMHGFKKIVTITRQGLDLRDQSGVNKFLAENEPQYVFLAAAKVGGIQANINAPADFLYDNLVIQNNIIHSSHSHNVKKIIYLGSSCIYPRDAEQPMKEDSLLTGPLEPTNEGYALAKIIGLKMTQYYQKQFQLDCLNVMPCNLYGTNDHYDPVNSHVMTALIRKFCDAVDSGSSEVMMWGTGSAKREFMHVDDFVNALFFLIEHWQTAELINVGTGVDWTIRELATIIAKEVGYQGRITWDVSKPDGMPRKCLDISKLQQLGFQSSINLEQGIRKTINEYRTLKKEGMIK